MINNYANKRIYIVGIKGTGLSNLALFLKKENSLVSGCDYPTYYKSEDLLKEANISWDENFTNFEALKSSDLVIHSAAYPKATNPLLIEAAKYKIPTFSYPEFLKNISESYPTYSISGTHGKSSTLGAASFIYIANNNSPIILGGCQLQQQSNTNKKDNFAIIEGCEYKDHYHLYKLKGLVITSIEFEHPDFFLDEQQLFNSFKKRVELLEEDSFVILCADYPLTKKLIGHIKNKKLITYGKDSTCDVRIEYIGKGEYKVGTKTYRSQFHSYPLIANLVAASLLVNQISNLDFENSLKILENYKGCKQRVEKLFEKEGVIFIDDYAHHPTEIKTSLKHIKSLYPDKTLFLIFYPHTLSRTIALFDEFVKELKQVENLFIRKVFASSRNDGKEDQLITISKSLATKSNGTFIEDKENLVSEVAKRLQANSVCVTMGAGNNSALAEEIASKREKLNG